MAGNEVAARNQGPVMQMVRSYTNDFSAVLPRHVNVETFMGLAAAYIRRDEKLRQAAQANPGSLIIALRECAALGHVPMKGTYSLVAYGNNVQGIEEVRGTIQRMYRAGGVLAVHVQLVRERDEFQWNPTMALPHHQFNPLAGEETRGPIVGVYAWANLRGGTVSQPVILGMDDIRRYESQAKTRKFWDGPWRPEMIQKTALHRLEKFVPTSAEYLWNINAAEAGSAQAFPGLPDTSPYVDRYETVEAEIVEPPARSGPDDDWPTPASPGEPS